MVSGCSLLSQHQDRQRDCLSNEQQCETYWASCGHDAEPAFTVGPKINAFCIVHLRGWPHLWWCVYNSPEEGTWLTATYSRLAFRTIPLLTTNIDQLLAKNTKLKESIAQLSNRYKGNLDHWVRPAAAQLYWPGVHGPRGSRFVSHHLRWLHCSVRNSCGTLPRLTLCLIVRPYAKSQNIHRSTGSGCIEAQEWTHCSSKPGRL